MQLPEGPSLEPHLTGQSFIPPLYHIPYPSVTASCATHIPRRKRRYDPRYLPPKKSSEDVRVARMPFRKRAKPRTGAQSPKREYSGSVSPDKDGEETQHIGDMIIPVTEDINRTYAQKVVDSFRSSFGIVKCRLARWGKYGGNEQQFEACLKKDDSDKMREILQGLVMSFQTCYKRSCRHFRKLDNDPPEDDASMELDQVLRQLRDHFHTVAMQGLSGAHLIEKTRWTVYNKSHAEILIRDCVSYIDELENDIQFGPEDLEEKARKDIEDVKDVDSLRRLKRLPHGVDSLMEIAAYSKY
ncbi:uncharacterized protein FFNC_15616 [Fusarium fujikuroi]|nr:uncharacterized protein FFNC_15616 [Fusarium fujikuroi]